MALLISEEGRKGKKKRGKDSYRRGEREGVLPPVFFVNLVERRDSAFRSALKERRGEREEKKRAHSFSS